MIWKESLWNRYNLWKTSFSDNYLKLGLQFTEMTLMKAQEAIQRQSKWNQRNYNLMAFNLSTYKVLKYFDFKYCIKTLFSGFPLSTYIFRTHDLSWLKFFSIMSIRKIRKTKHWEVSYCYWTGVVRKRAKQVFRSQFIRGERAL